jgi:FkbM family methyltransferase
MQKTRQIKIHGEPFTVAITNKWDRGFWESYADNWEVDTFAFVKDFAGPGVVFFDIGAWIGPISLYAARLGSQVVALEPDPIARQVLIQNCDLNDINILIHDAALSDSHSGMALFGGSRGLGASTSSSLGVDPRNRIKVNTITADDLLNIQQYGKSAIKIDIEGHEYRIPGTIERLWRQSGGPMHLSMHPRTYFKRLRRSLTFSSRQKTLEHTIKVLSPFFGRGRFSDSNTELNYNTLVSRFGPNIKNHANFEVVVGPPDPEA